MANKKMKPCKTCGEMIAKNAKVCPKCGASFELRYGSGQCAHCGTHYTTQFKLISDNFSVHEASHNIVLADNILESDDKFMIPIDFTNDEQIKGSLNLQDNTHLLYRKIKIHCFFTKVLQVIGGRPITDYELLPNE